MKVILALVTACITTVASAAGSEMTSELRRPTVQVWVTMSYNKLCSGQLDAADMRTISEVGDAVRYFPDVATWNRPDDALLLDALKPSEHVAAERTKELREGVDAARIILSTAGLKWQSEGISVCSEGRWLSQAQAFAAQLRERGIATRAQEINALIKNPGR